MPRLVALFCLAALDFLPLRTAACFEWRDTTPFNRKLYK